MRRLSFPLCLALTLVVLAAPIFADRVDISDTSGLGTLYQSGGTNLTGDFSAHLDTNIYYNPTTGVYSYVFALSMPAGISDAPALRVNPGAPFDLAGLDWGLVNGAPSTGPDLGFTGTNPDGSTFFTFSGSSGSDTVTVYGQSIRPPEEVVASLLENHTHRQAGGKAPPPVPEPGTLLLMGGGLALASRAIRRRIARRKQGQ